MERTKNSSAITAKSEHARVRKAIKCCIVLIHFYSASHSMSLSEALPTTAIDTVSEFLHAEALFYKRVLVHTKKTIYISVET